MSLLEGTTSKCSSAISRVVILYMVCLKFMCPIRHVPSPSSKKHPQEHRTNQREDVRPTPVPGFSRFWNGGFLQGPKFMAMSTGKISEHDDNTWIMRSLCSNTAWVATLEQVLLFALLERHRDILNPRMSTQPNNQPHFVMRFFHFTPNMYQNGKCGYVYIYICRDR